MDSIVHPNSALELLNLQIDSGRSSNDSVISGLSQDLSRRRLLAAAASATLLGTAGRAFAQANPTGPVRMVHGYTVGTVPDILGRLIGPSLGTRLGTQVLVDARPGASEKIAAGHVSQARPDGLTVYLMTGGLTVVSATDRSLQLDLLKDLSYIGMISAYPLTFNVSSASPFRTVKDLIDGARARPGKISYGSVGIGTTLHLAMELFCSMAGISMHHVPYKGLAAQTDMLAGVIDMAVGTTVGLDPLLKDGRVRALCVSSPTRWTGFDNVPALSETVPGFDVVTWTAMAAPPSLPAAIQTRLSNALTDTLKEPDLRAKIEASGPLVRTNSPNEMRSLVEANVQKWRKVAKDANIELS
jgi:tripartite-type tricarboxylate transporter receptor subunit TctC